MSYRNRVLRRFVTDPTSIETAICARELFRASDKPADRYFHLARTVLRAKSDTSALGETLGDQEPTLHDLTHRPLAALIQSHAASEDTFFSLCEPHLVSEGLSPKLISALCGNRLTFEPELAPEDLFSWLATVLTRYGDRNDPALSSYPNILRQCLVSLAGVGRINSAASFLQSHLERLKSVEDLDAAIKNLFAATALKAGRPQLALHLASAESFPAVDTYWALGDIDSVRRWIENCDPRVRFSPDWARRMERFGMTEEALGEIDNAGSDIDVLQLRTLRWLLGKQVGPIEGRTVLGIDSPWPQLSQARIAYSELRFDEAYRLSFELIGTQADIEARRLCAQVVNEFDETDFALKILDTGPVDKACDVRFHLLRQLGLDREAAANKPGDNRLREFSEVFPNLSTELPRSGHCVVIGEAGPGDDLQHFPYIYGLVNAGCSVTAIADPRTTPALNSIFAEVSDSVTVRPTPRLSHFSFGALKNGVENSFGHLLDESAYAVALCADHVVPVQMLEPLSDTETQRWARTAKIEPKATEVTLAHPLCVPRVGFDSLARPEIERRGKVVAFNWRSERLSPWRRNQYLQVEQLADFLPVDAVLVCCQYDITETERVWLEGHFEVIFPDIDMRNDLTTTAAFFKKYIDLFIGVGTSTTVLAARCGIDTQLVLPSRLGSWRSHTKGDYWFESTISLTL